MPSPNWRATDLVERRPGHSLAESLSVCNISSYVTIEDRDASITSEVQVTDFTGADGSSCYRFTGTTPGVGSDSPGSPVQAHAEVSVRRERQEHD